MYLAVNHINIIDVPFDFQKLVYMSSYKIIQIFIFGAYMQSVRVIKVRQEINA